MVQERRNTKFCYKSVLRFDQNLNFLVKYSIFVLASNGVGGKYLFGKTDNSYISKTLQGGQTTGLIFNDGLLQAYHIVFM